MEEGARIAEVDNQRLQRELAEKQEHEREIMVLLLLVTSTADKIYIHRYILHACSISPSNQNDLKVTREQLTATDAEKHIIQTELDRVKVCRYYAYMKVSHEWACMCVCVRVCICACMPVYVIVLRQVCACVYVRAYMCVYKYRLPYCVIKMNHMFQLSVHFILYILHSQQQNEDQARLAVVETQRREVLVRQQLEVKYMIYSLLSRKDLTTEMVSGLYT